MWLWASELHALGFRRKSDGYWQCERRFGLSDDEHLSVFTWGEHPVPGSGGACWLIEVSTFHVTFEIGSDNVHFYYHEMSENGWRPAGHTSSAEIRRLGHRPKELRRTADAIARRVVEALGGMWHPRH